MRKTSGQIIVFANTKGGVGKTTLTACTAVYLAATGKRAGVVTLDPQGDLERWAKLRRDAGHEPQVELFTGEDRLDDAIDAIEVAGLDYVLIDCPPGTIEKSEAALSSADLVVIPIKGAAHDIWAKETVVNMVASASIPHMLVINESPPGWKITKATRSVLEGEGLLVSPNDIKTRADYRIAPIEGLTAPEIERGNDAADEIAQLWADIQHAIKRWRQHKAKQGARA